MLNRVSSGEYRPRIFKQDGRYVIVLDDLAILVSDKDMATAHQKYLQEVEEHIATYEAAGCLDLLPNSRRAAKAHPQTGVNQSGRSFFEELGIFVAKLVIIGVVVAPIFYVGATMVERVVVGKVSSAVHAVKSEIRIQVANAPKRAHEMFGAMASHLSSSPPEAKEKLHEDLRTLAKALRPFMDELLAIGPNVDERDASPSPRTAD